MFDKLRDRSSPWMVWTVRIVLTLIALTFAVWGVESYFTRSALTDAVASVGNAKITQHEFAESLRAQQESLRQRGNTNPEFFRSEEFKTSVLDTLISRRLLLRDARRAGLTITDQQLAQRIQAIAAFQVDGKFSRQIYEGAARSRGLSEAAFDELLREDFLVQDYYNGIANSSLMSNTALDRFIKLSDQQREISVATIAADQFLAQSSVPPADAKKYYDSHQEEFKIAEQAKVEYVVYSAEQLSKQIEVTPAEVEAAYKEREREFVQKEERQASHILIAAPSDSKDADRDAARKKAETVLAQAKADPGKFAELAKQYSEDPGSAADGGRLEFENEDGQLVAPFKEAMFKMNRGEIVGPVETEFGYHIIKLDDIRPQRGKSLAEVSEQLKLQLQRQKAGRRFAETAEEFGDLVYDQAIGLKGAAEKLKLELKQSDWLTKGGGATNDPVLGSPKLLSAVFQPLVLKEKRTTEPVEISPNVLVAARVIDSKPAAIKPFDAVNAEIIEKLKHDAAIKLAKKKGEDTLAALIAGKPANDLSWGTASTVSRQNPGELAPDVLQAAFAAATAKLPAYVGRDDAGGGYHIIRISKVIDADKIDDARRIGARAQLQQLYQNAFEGAVLAGLRSRASVTVNRQALVEETTQ